MSFFSSLEALAGSFGSIFHDSASIGVSSRMGDSLFSNGDNGYKEFGENVTSSTLSSGFGSGGFDGGSSPF